MEMEGPFDELLSGAIPSITSEQIIDDGHGKNPCMLTKIGNVAEMPFVAESCPRGGLKIQNFLTWIREFFLKKHVLMPARAYFLFFTAS